MKELYIYQRGKKLRCGYTTGSCATAAAKAAALMLHQQQPINQVKIQTPDGIELSFEILNPVFDRLKASCSVIKDAGDDHDSTDGMEIIAEVRKRADHVINIEGGEGIGRITRPGFWGKVGDAAINPVPRQMISGEISSVYDCGWDIIISAPRGKEIAGKTLNEKLGIIDGISIIGTKGIVEPMSVDAFKQTIYLEIDSIHNSGSDEVLLFLGNYGQMVAEQLGLSAPSVKISNFIGDSVLYCKNLGFKKVTLIGHIGKLSKLSLGAFYTHSSTCDLRLEAFVYYLALAGAPLDLMEAVNHCSDTEEALNKVFDNNYGKIVTNMRQGCIDRIRKYVKDPDFNVDVLIYSMERGVL
ncbi:cobalt-precorrin-5B (C(1))-methyltransferase CbiD [bacterium]|nr:cobalt-precorrin-5B (C(1))-methyltransferase CbiD [bacterium]